MKLVLWLRGKKTYIVAIIAAATTFLEQAGLIGIVPTYVWQVLASLGLITLRAGIGTKENA